MSDGNWETREIEVLSERNYGASGLLVLRIVQFLKDGKKMGGPKLELREFYNDRASGLRKIGKIKGIGFSEMETILRVGDRMLGLLYPSRDTSKVSSSVESSQSVLFKQDVSEVGPKLTEEEKIEKYLKETRTNDPQVTNDPHSCYSYTDEDIPF